MKKLKIYYAHPIFTYGTELETGDMKEIEKKYSNAEIINPNGMFKTADDWVAWMKKKPFKKIDVIVIRESTEMWLSKGVFDEMKQATDNDCEVCIFDVDTDNLIGYFKHDIGWKVHYAKRLMEVAPKRVDV